MMNSSERFQFELVSGEIQSLINDMTHDGYNSFASYVRKLRVIKATINSIIDASKKERKK